MDGPGLRCVFTCTDVGGAECSHVQMWAERSASCPWSVLRVLSQPGAEPRRERLAGGGGGGGGGGGRNNLVFYAQSTFAVISARR